MSLLQSLSILPIVLILVKDRLEGNFDTELAWMIVNHVLPATTAGIALFFMNIEKRYLKSFWSTESGPSFTARSFRAAQSDALKADILSRHEHFWPKEEIKEWIESNWANWEEEKPSWLNEYLKSRIPVSYIPSDKARMKEATRRGSLAAIATRRGSLAAIGQLVKTKNNGGIREMDSILRFESEPHQIEQVDIHTSVVAEAEKGVSGAMRKK